MPTYYAYYYASISDRGLETMETTTLLDFISMIHKLDNNLVSFS